MTTKHAFLSLAVRAFDCCSIFSPHPSATVSLHPPGSPRPGDLTLLPEFPDFMARRVPEANESLFFSTFQFNHDRPFRFLCSGAAVSLSSFEPLP